MSEDTAKIIYITSALSVILPLTAGLLFFKKLPNLAKAFLLLLLWAGVVDTICVFVESSKTNILLNIYRLTEVIFFTWFLIKVLDAQVFQKKQNKIYAAIILLYAITHFLILKNYKLLELNSYFDQICFMALSFLSAYVILKTIETAYGSVIKKYFLFVSGIFIYVFCTNLLFSFITNDEFRDKLWIIHNAFNIFCSIIYAIAFITFRKKEIRK